MNSISKRTQKDYSLVFYNTLSQSRLTSQRIENALALMDLLPGNALSDLFNHATKWLTNLYSANEALKQESIVALRSVITAARETAIYMRQLDDCGKQDHKTERHLSLL